MEMDALPAPEEVVTAGSGVRMEHVCIDRPRPDIAEDAPPLFVSVPPFFVAAVFDGLGGAGARKVDGEDGIRSSAYYGARLAREAVASLATKLAPSSFDDERNCTEAFAAAIAASLSERNKTVPVQSGVIRSSMLRSYPTTAAILIFEQREDNIEALSLWAGDSRCYLLTPALGLQQLSVDDSATGADPMEALRDDGPMTNLLSADAPCMLRSNIQSIAAPALLLVASDGAFGYLPSPMHFEFVLLETLAVAADLPEWERRLGDALAGAASDDVSLVAVLIGWPDLAAAAAALAGRLDEMRRKLESYNSARAAANHHEQEARTQQAKAQTLLAEGWNDYRDQYLARIGACS